MIRKIHIYAALLTIVNLIVYTIAGLYGAFSAHRAAAPNITYISYRGTPGESDLQTADRVVEMLGLTLATPVRPFAIQHDPSGNLLLDFYHANGRHRVTVQSDRRLLQIEATRNSFARYSDILHMTTGVFSSDDWRMQLWAYFNEIAMWSLLVTIATSLWMTAARIQSLTGWWDIPVGIRSVHFIAALLALPFMIIFAVSGLQMAHRTWFPSSEITTGPIAWVNHVHQSSGWSAGAMALGLLILIATGVYLWLLNPRERRVGMLFAIPGGGLALALVILMRSC